MRSSQAILYGWCLVLAVTMCVGQIMFKMASTALGQDSPSFQKLLISPWFLGAACLYALSTFLWVYILSRMPLSVAYPFALLGAALVPLAAYFIFGETLTPRIWAGLALVLVGLWIMNFK